MVSLYLPTYHASRGITLALELGAGPAELREPAGVALLAGQAPQGVTAVAQAYAGHQFGVYSPRLGDGRALLLGEVSDVKGRRRDLHLKGSGRTPFSRGGDGKAAVGPMLREYLIGEAMHGLGIPTTRALAVVATGERVIRERALPGAVLTRVAASHLRVGTFQYAAASLVPWCAPSTADEPTSCQERRRHASNKRLDGGVRRRSTCQPMPGLRQKSARRR